MDADPPWAKHLEGEVPLGRHVVTFRARSPLSPHSPPDSCRMTILVKDPFPPRVRECPESFTEYLSGGEITKRVLWTEPIFHDNIKVHHQTSKLDFSGMAILSFKIGLFKAYFTNE